MNDRAVHEDLRRLLCSLQDHLREGIVNQQATSRPEDLAKVAAVTPSDTLYQIDRISEEIIHAWFRENWPEELPVELLMEGQERKATYPEGTVVEETHWKCLLDPIDGTRNLMVDKRSAWVLAGIAPQKGNQNVLRDIQVAAMTELPTTKSWRSDQLSAIRGAGLSCTAHDLRNRTTEPLKLRPSQAGDCRHGFATITRFFPCGLEALSRIEETLWKQLYKESPGGSPVIFNDQYLTTGGQLYELIAGHDRFIADLRPVVFSKLNPANQLSCHPYDLAAVLVAEEAGVLVENPLTGASVDAPMDTTTPVCWVGYANAAIADAIRPVLRDILEKFRSE